MASSPEHAIEIVGRYIDSLEGERRQVAAAEWGLTVDAAGWPLHVGLAVREGFVRAQAEVVEPGRIAPEILLQWNRALPLVRFSHTAAGAVYVQGELQIPAVTSVELDGFLGLLVRVATQAREAVVAADAARVDDAR